MTQVLKEHVEQGDKWFNYTHNIHTLPVKFADVDGLNPASCMDRINQLPALQQLVRAGYRVRFTVVPYVGGFQKLCDTITTGIMICVQLSDCSLHSSQCNLCGFKPFGGGYYKEVVDSSITTSSSSNCIIV